MIDWPTCSDAAKLSDEQLLEKLHGFGLDVDRAELEAGCAQALSAEEVARPLLDRCGVGATEGRPHEDWIWLCLLEFGGAGGPSGCASSSSATRSRRATTRSSAGRRLLLPRSGSTRGLTSCVSVS